MQLRSSTSFTSTLTVHNPFCLPFCCRSKTSSRNIWKWSHGTTERIHQKQKQRAETACPRSGISLWKASLSRVPLPVVVVIIWIETASGTDLGFLLLLRHLNLSQDRHVMCKMTNLCLSVKPKSDPLPGCYVLCCRSATRGHCREASPLPQRQQCKRRCCCRKSWPHPPPPSGPGLF